jgi:NADH-ubiquinone oxidoreductase chain 4L
MFPDSISYLFLLSNTIFVSYFLFYWGFVILSKTNNNLMIIIIGLELTLLSLSFIFILYSLLWHNFAGFTIIFVLLTLGGAESALGLALIMMYYNLVRTIDLSQMAGLKH